MNPTTACVINLGPREARKRLVFGISLLGLGVVASGVLWFFDVSAWWRLLLFFPYWLGLLGLLEARTRT
jgi:hypothetical protein